MKITREEAERISQEKLSDPSSRGMNKKKLILRGLNNWGQTLDKHPDYYRAFGPYWWIMKKLFRTYINDYKKWYCSDMYNASDASKYGFNDEWLDHIAAIYYASQHTFDRPEWHIMKDDEDGPEDHYYIHDEDAPC
jgi:hypothetical protein